MDTDLSGSARVRVCGVPRRVSRAAAVKPRASVPATSSGYPAVCTPSPRTVSAPRERSRSFRLRIPIAILVISCVLHARFHDSYQIIKTRNYVKYVLKETIETDKCRSCHKTTKSIDHATEGCSSLACKEYTHRHDKVTNYMNQQLALIHNLLNTYTPYYKYKSANLLENSFAKLYWDRDVIDRTVLSNIPDIKLIINHTKTTYLIDITVSNTSNLKQNTPKKKYILLADETKQMWHQKYIRIIQMIILSTRVIPKTLKIAFKTLQLPDNTYIIMQSTPVQMVRRFLNQTSLSLDL
ncbi:hypothetical protein EVAR_25182_1 [Eumeta japonica]|uniref:Uncharacterized protein n=1 Tax=Eumeta variegata TaxID=151549 RepID=A0A4C1VRN0_EUMVA|nr:hypothetical protein EVAR_25182_1 [Eumeta japonica]